MNHIKFKTEFLPQLREHLDILEKQDPGSEVSKNVSIVEEITASSVRVVFRDNPNLNAILIFSYSDTSPVIYVYHYSRDNKYGYWDVFNYDIFSSNDPNLIKSVIKSIYKRLFNVTVYNNLVVDFSKRK